MKIVNWKIINCKLKEKLKFLITKLNGNNQYQKYLQHFQEQHSDQTPLTKQQFFAQREQEKWSKINRCC